MRILGAFILITFYFIGMLRPIQPYLEYELRKDYILEFLCVNKDKPITRCLGSCFLEKRIAESQQGSSEDSSFFQVNMDDYPIGFICLMDLDRSNLQIEYEFTINDPGIYLDPLLSSLFRPPIFA